MTADWMLTEKERTEISAEAARYEKKSAAGIEALKIVQRSRGWVSDESLREIAKILGMTPDELDSVATFYNLIFRRPVGRHVILVCDTISCWVMGYEEVIKHLQERGLRMGETTGDGLFTLLPVPCLGACDEAPAMMIDGDLYGNLTPVRIDEILQKYRGGDR